MTTEQSKNKTPAAVVGRLRQWAADIRRDHVMREVFSIHLAAMDDAAEVIAALDSSLTASEKRAQDMAKALLVANKLWRLAVEDNWPWNDGDIQDKLTEIGLLKATDMRAEDSPEECLNCIGDCHTCYRAVQLIEDAPGNANE